MSFDQGPADWLQAQLFDRRIVACRGVLDAGLVGRVAASLMALDALGDESISLHLDCTGPSLEDAFGLVDVIDLLGVPVRAVCSGRVEGAVVGVLAAATRREALPHVRIRLVDPELSLSGTGEQLTRGLEYHRQLLERLYERIAVTAHRSVRDVADAFGAGRYFDATQALDYGLVESISQGAPGVRSITTPRAAGNRQSGGAARQVGFEPDRSRPRQ